MGGNVSGFVGHGNVGTFHHLLGSEGSRANTVRSIAATGKGNLGTVQQILSPHVEDLSHTAAHIDGAEVESFGIDVNDRNC